tara:strand:- start:178 stop:429 length:252 start_codon:yes stop_codon:yes gene_type:complete
MSIFGDDDVVAMRSLPERVDIFQGDNRNILFLKFAHNVRVVAYYGHATVTQRSFAFTSCYSAASVKPCPACKASSMITVREVT